MAAVVALQTQAKRVFLAEWGRQAVGAAVPFDAILAGYIRVMAQDAAHEPAANGFHRTLADETPYVAIPYGVNWLQTASHMLLRPLADPSGAARVPGPSRLDGQGTIE